MTVRERLKTISENALLISLTLRGLTEAEDTDFEDIRERLDDLAEDTRSQAWWLKCSLEQQLDTPALTDDELEKVTS